jgi:hypothetical protein
MNRKTIATLAFGAISTAALLLAFAGCSQGGEGDRCNPDLSSGSYGSTSAKGDCNGGFVCFQPSLCAENYCCPPPGADGTSPSSNPNCQTGCNGGAASICYASQGDDAACGFACQNQQSDLQSLFETYNPSALVEDGGVPPMCVAPAPEDSGSVDAGTDGGQDAGVNDAANDAPG